MSLIVLSWYINHLPVYRKELLIMWFAFGFLNYFNYALITVCFSTLVCFLFLVLLQILYTLLYRLATAS